MRVFGLVFAGVGAGLALLIPSNPGLNASLLTVAGIGAIAGWIFGAATGLALDRLFQDGDTPSSPIPLPEPSPPSQSGTPVAEPVAEPLAEPVADGVAEAVALPVLPAPDSRLCERELWPTPAPQKNSGRA